MEDGESGESWESWKNIFTNYLLEKKSGECFVQSILKSAINDFVKVFQQVNKNPSSQLTYAKNK